MSYWKDFDEGHGRTKGFNKPRDISDPKPIAPQRYRIGLDGELAEHPAGAFLSYSDYEKAEQRIAKLEEVLELIERNVPNGVAIVAAALAATEGETR